MKWTEHHDIYFLKEMMLCQPWQHKKGSSERWKTWAMQACCKPNQKFKTFISCYTEVIERPIPSFGKKAQEEGL